MTPRLGGPILRWVGWKQGLPDARALRASALAVGLVVGFALAVVMAAAAGSGWRMAAGIGGGVGFAVLAMASGNPRLFVLWGLMFTLPFDFSVYLGAVSDRAGGERALRVELSDPMILALLGFQLRDLLQGRWPGLRVPRVTFIWIGIMLFWGVGTMIEGRFRMSAAYEVIRMVKLTVLFVVVVNELDTPGRMLHAAMALTFSMLFQAAVGLAQYWNGQPFGLEFLGEIGAKTADALAVFSVRDSKVFRISGFVLHPNLFGIFLAACLPLALGGLMLGRGLASRVFFGLAGAAGLVALILTQSRSAWVGLAAAVVLVMVLMLMHRKLFARAISAAAVGAVVVAIVFAAFQEPIMKRLFDSKEVAAVGREEFKEDARRLIDEKIWLGWGLNQYVQELPPYMKSSPRSYSWWIPPVHNIYYLWWAETGFIGLCVHLAMWIAIAFMACRNLRVRDDVLFIMSLACLGAMLALAIDGYLSFSLRVNPITRLYWVLAAMIYATYYWRREQEALQAVPRGTA